MAWLALRQLAGRRTSSGLAALGLLVATLGFIVLVSTSQTTRAVLQGDIARTWATPYDLLVRPAGSVTSLEARQGLVRPNYVSGLASGGITRTQLDIVRRIPGVEVAAPVAIAGAVNWQVGGFGMDLSREPKGQPLAVYRLRITSTTDAGLSTGTIETHYLVVASQGEVRYLQGSRDAVLRIGKRTIGCSYPVTCFAPRVCDQGPCGPPADPPQYGVEMLQPIVIAGVDPVAEARLAGLDRCVQAGRYLAPGDRVRGAPDRDPPGTRIPVLVSGRSFVDETLVGRLARAPDETRVLAGGRPADLRGWRPVRQASMSAADLYRAYLPRVGTEVDEWPLWSMGDVSYGRRPDGSLAAATRGPDLSIYQRSNVRMFGEELTVPPAARDRWFRQVTQHGYLGPEGNRYWDPVGTYDPGCLPGFDPLAGGGLETYSAPSVRLGDGRELRPSRSLGGYVNSPPLLLTTMEGAAWLSDPARFQGRPGAAFISVVRVRVAGIGEPGAVAQARLGRVAADIREATGLQVDVVKGASPRAVQVSTCPPVASAAPPSPSRSHGRSRVSRSASPARSALRTSACSRWPWSPPPSWSARPPTSRPAGAAPSSGCCARSAGRQAGSPGWSSWRCCCSASPPGWSPWPSACPSPPGWGWGRSPGQPRRRSPLRWPSPAWPPLSRRCRRRAARRPARSPAGPGSAAAARRARRSPSGSATWPGCGASRRCSVWSRSPSARPCSAGWCWSAPRFGGSSTRACSAST